jgi:hypothetical protein
MRRILIVVAAITSVVAPVVAQQGPNFPSPGSDRGPNFPKSVSPTDANPTNWAVPQPQYTDPNGPNARWNRWSRRRGWRGEWHR